MAAGLRAIAFLLSAGCVVALSLPSTAQSLSDHCSSGRQVKAWRTANEKGPEITTRVESVIFEGDIHMPVPEQEQATEALEQRTWTSDPNLAELKNVAGSVARAEWQKRGYFKAQVTNVTAELLTSAPSELTAAVTFYIEEGPLYRLADISFRNVTVFPQEQLRALFPMQPSDVFNTEKVRIGLDGLRKVYGTRGYINFTSVPDTEIDEINHRISLVIDVDQGKQFRLIQPSIVGLDQALADTLLQKWPIKGGEVYNTSLVEQFFRQNASLLPVGANPENNIVRKIDEHQGTVGLILDFRPCQ